MIYQVKHGTIKHGNKYYPKGEIIPIDEQGAERLGHNYITIIDEIPDMLEKSIVNHKDKIMEFNTEKKNPVITKSIKKFSGPRKKKSKAPVKNKN